MQTRTLAARILVDVVDFGVTLEQAFTQIIRHHQPTLDSRDQAFLQELCYGVLRWLPRLRFQLGQLLRKPLKSGDADIEYLLLAGLYQILELRTPDHAAVSASVDACGELGKPWAGKLCNAVLRRAARERESLQEQAAKQPVAALAHPKWLLKTLQEAWPEDWQAIARANNERPPLYIRVNQRLIDRQRYSEMLSAAGLEAMPHAHADQALRVVPAISAAKLPGFERGLISIQDAAAQLAAKLLGLQPGQRVLDACAAPGGKTAHILETEPDLAEVIAVDLSADRLERLKLGLQRLRLTATCIAADATRPQTWWDSQLFDRILLDAPCTGSGVIRRHPDIKYHRDKAAIAAAAETQSQLLTSLWPLLAPGGKLLYATCSFIPAENTEQIASFIARHGDAEEMLIDAPWGRQMPYGRQILPGDVDMDGFYYACLKKT